MTLASNNTLAVRPNALTIEGLREVADWLEAHPELPECGYAHVCAVYRYASPRRKPGEARAQLTALAEALGDTAVERRSGGEAVIESKFGSVWVYGRLPVSELVDAPPPPTDYDRSSRRAMRDTLPTSTGARNIGVRNRAPVSVRGTREQGPRPAEVGNQTPTQEGTSAMTAVAASVKARGTGSGEGIYPHDERRERSRDGSPRVAATRAAGARLTGQSAPRARTSRQEIAGCLRGEIKECQHGPSASPAHDAAPAPGSRTGAVTFEARDA